MLLSDYPRKLARHVGLGRTVLKLRHWQNLGLRRTWQLSVAKRTYLPLITQMKPIEAHAGAIEAHILLHHARILEGIWALYSLAYFAARPCQFIIHDDGSLTASDELLLQRILPGCRVVPRWEADAKVIDCLRRRGLERSARLRETLIFGLKLFDLAFFGENENLILLDSDVLFFSRPDALLEGMRADNGSVAKYSLDVQNNYCLGDLQMREALGRACIDRFSPGVLRAPRAKLSFERMESHLNHSGFWNADGSANYFAELTLWAMQMTDLDAVPLPESYAICPREFYDSDLVFGHFCGGTKSAFVYYTTAVPHLLRIFASSPNSSPRSL